jgi:hypothetical protein
VEEVVGREVTVQCKREVLGYDYVCTRTVTVHLTEGVEKPEILDVYAFKGVVEPFT